jgi:hypothetical protein
LSSPACPRILPGSGRATKEQKPALRRSGREPRGTAEEPEVGGPARIMRAGRCLPSFFRVVGRLEWAPRTGARKHPRPDTGDRHPALLRSTECGGRPDAVSVAPGEPVGTDRLDGDAGGNGGLVCPGLGPAHASHRTPVRSRFLADGFGRGMGVGPRSAGRVTGRGGCKGGAVGGIMLVELAGLPVGSLSP